MQHLTLVTSDGQEFVKRKEKLQIAFSLFPNFIEEFPDANYIELKINAETWSLIDRFLRFLELPSKKEDLIAMVEVMNYLEPIGSYKKVLLEGIEKKIKDLGLRPLLDPEPSLLDLKARLELGNQHFTDYEDKVLCTVVEDGKRCLKMRWNDSEFCFGHRKRGQGPQGLQGTGGSTGPYIPPGPTGPYIPPGPTGPYIPPGPTGH